MYTMTLNLPVSGDVLHPGDIVKLHRFDSKLWKVCFGWYSFGGNRPVCGWYLETDDGMTVKPLQLPDLDDIYLLSR